MALPILNVPHYETELLSEKKTVQYRPFLVKEQKVLLTAVQTGERKDALRALTDCVKACTTGVDVDSLPAFDLERLFLLIRAKSVGEILSVNVKCDACGEYNPVDVNLVSDMKIQNRENVTNKVPLTDAYGLIFRFPTANDIQESTAISDAEEISFYFELAKRCLKGVYEGEEFFSAQDATRAELDKVFEAFGNNEFEKIRDHFDKVPTVAYDMDFVCSKCKAENQLHVEGVDSFFG